MLRTGARGLNRSLSAYRSASFPAAIVSIINACYYIWLAGLARRRDGGWNDRLKDVTDGASMGKDCVTIAIG